MKSIFPLFILSSGLALADCKLPDGTSLKEGESKSLFDKGGSLETQKTQDQDGLGTCYANAASVLLKASLPNHPDISYQHAALMGNANKWFTGTNNHFVTRKTPDSHSILNPDSASDVNQGSMEFGFTCEVIDSLKASGGACEQKYSKIEKGSLDEKNSQAAALKGLGAYFDALNRTDNVDEKQIAKDLDSALELIQSSKGKGRKELECSSSVIPFDSASSAILQNFGIMYAGEDEPMQKALAKIVTNMSSSPKVTLASDGSINENDLLAKESVKNFFAQNINKSDELKSFKEIEDLSRDILALQRASRACHTSAGKDQEAHNRCYEALEASNEKDLIQKRDLLCTKLNKKFSDLVISQYATGLDDGQKQAVRQIMDTGMTLPCQAAGEQKANLCNKEGLLEKVGRSELARAQARSNQCSMNVEMLAEGLGALVDFGHKLDREVLLDMLTKKWDKSKNDGYNYADQITDILMPECKANKIPIPENMGCKKENFCKSKFVSAKVQKLYNFAQNKKNWNKLTEQQKANANAYFANAETKDTCISSKDAEKKFAAQTLSAINNQRPVEVSICADFLINTQEVGKDGKTKKSNFCASENKMKHTSDHSVTATGYRCKEGKLQYQVLNSWGMKCPAKNPGIECERGGHKICRDPECKEFEASPTGRFWVDQEVLVDHSTGLSQITTGEEGKKK